MITMITTIMIMITTMMIIVKIILMVMIVVHGGNDYICMKDDLQLGKLKENCLLLELYRKLRKMFLSPRRESNPQPFDLR